MACLTPLTLYRKERSSSDNHVDTVPCGRCPNCLKRRINQWAFRLEKEQNVSLTSSFTTLTYADETLPYSENGYPTLNMKDHQDFMKRLRKSVRKFNLKHHPEQFHRYKMCNIETGKTFDKLVDKYPLKYYAVGEYGDENHRPHFHQILFNLPQLYINREEFVHEIWDKGKIQIATCNTATMKYVAGYINKRIHPKQQDSLDDRTIEFSMMSKGLGKNFITPQTTKYYQTQLQPFLKVENGTKLSMPRYYKDKMYKPWQKLRLAKKAKIYNEENQPFEDGKQEFDYVKNQLNIFNTKNNFKKRLL